MAARFSELWGSGLICQQDPQKQLGIKYLKETKFNEDQLVSSKAKLCFSSVFFSEEARGSGDCANKFSDRMIKRLFMIILNSVFTKYRDFQCLADQLFASAFDSIRH